MVIGLPPEEALCGCIYDSTNEKDINVTKTEISFAVSSHGYISIDAKSAASSLLTEPRSGLSD